MVARNACRQVSGPSCRKARRENVGYPSVICNYPYYTILVHIVDKGLHSRIHRANAFADRAGGKPNDHASRDGRGGIWAWPRCTKSRSQVADQGRGESKCGDRYGEAVLTKGRADYKRWTVKNMPVPSSRRPKPYHSSTAETCRVTGPDRRRSAQRSSRPTWSWHAARRHLGIAPNQSR